MLTGRQDLWQLRITIASDQAKLAVGTAGQKLALVDTTDFRASAPATALATKLIQTVSHHGDRTSLAYGVAALATVLAASTLSVALRRRRARLVPTA